MEFFLVLLLVAAVCAGVPLALFAYDRGRLRLPRWLVGLLAVCVGLLAAMSAFPLFPRESPAGLLGSLAAYGLIGYFLRRTYTKANWLPCGGLVLAASCAGIGTKWLACRIGMFPEAASFFSPEQIALFLPLSLAAALLLFFTAADPPPKKEKTYEKPGEHRRS